MNAGDAVHPGPPAWEADDRLAVTVLKLGGSVLTGGDAVFRAVEEIHRHLDRHRRVAVVVSARWGATDGLERLAQRFTSATHSSAYAALLATGEARSAACLTLALEACGVPAVLLEAHRLALATAGPRTAAEPRGVGPALRECLERVPVVVVPGFVGFHRDGSTTLLGRGGTDLTAVFLAHHLEAEECRLLKDVDGWFTGDPATDASARPYATLHWDDAVASQAPIVQPRAVRLARRLGRPFTVAALSSEGGTRVGPWASAPAVAEEGRPPGTPASRPCRAPGLSRSTLLVHPPAVPGEPSGASSTPIYQTATFHLAGGPSTESARWDYSRSGNPTRDVLEAQLATLEGGADVRALAYNSGVAALQGALALVPVGGEVIVGDDLYGGTRRLLARMAEQRRVRVVPVDTTDPDAVAAVVGDDTDLLLVESPSNPRLWVSPIGVLARIAHRHGALLAVDNSLLSSYLMQPLALGADLAIQSATKLLGGHGDLTAGVSAVQDAKLATRLAFDRNATGSALAPFESWLLLRGLQTLGVRLDRQLETARRVVAFLRAHPRVEQVWYPRHGPGGVVISFATGSPERSRAVVEESRLFATTVSFGAARSSISLPAEMSHACVPEEERRRHGLAQDLVRLSIGIEDGDELLADLGAALGKGAVPGKTAPKLSIPASRTTVQTTGRRPLR